MYSRIYTPPGQSFFIFGPRGVGKSTYLKTHYPKAPLVDLLNDEVYNRLLADPTRLARFIPSGQKSDFVIIDEIQKLPKLLDEVHRLMENKKIKFILTGSSARKLKKAGTNLLAGRALTTYMFPLTSRELGKDFYLLNSLEYGHLPMAYSSPNPQAYLASYVRTYLEEEVKQEGLSRNLGAFARFLEAASFSQGSVLNATEVARDCAVERKVVENYFSILEDLRLAYRIPVFTKKAKRRLISHSKFYYFDVGLYQTIRPKGPLDSPENVEGAALETLVLQELMAFNHYLNWEYKIHFWRTASQLEVDFILYGKKGLVAIEVKRSSKIHLTDLKSLIEFQKDYPIARCYMVYTGTHKHYEAGVEIWPVEDFLKELPFKK